MAFALFSMLNTARDNRIRSLAVPAIGTGVFKFPAILAARITAKVLCEFEKNSDAIDLVRICVVSEEMKKLYESAIALEGEPC
jgi:O-acetyl-ADP-ribose deacetylase (regulator of RNase III)